MAALHASIMFAGNLRYMLPKLDVARAGPLLFRVDRIRPNHPAEEFWIEMMLGYIVYDTCAGFFTGANGTDIILHHLLGGISWASLLLTRTGGIFAMWIHLAEARARALSPAAAAASPHFPAGLDAQETHACPEQQ